MALEQTGQPVAHEHPQVRAAIRGRFDRPVKVLVCRETFLRLGGQRGGPFLRQALAQPPGAFVHDAFRHPQGFQDGLLVDRLAGADAPDPGGDARRQVREVIRRHGGGGPRVPRRRLNLPRFLQRGRFLRA